MDNNIKRRTFNKFFATLPLIASPLVSKSLAALEPQAMSPAFEGPIVGFTDKEKSSLRKFYESPAPERVLFDLNSYSCSTSFSVEQAFEIGQISIYENIIDEVILDLKMKINHNGIIFNIDMSNEYISDESGIIKCWTETHEDNIGIEGKVRVGLMQNGEPVETLLGHTYLLSDRYDVEIIWGGYSVAMKGLQMIKHTFRSSANTDKIRGNGAKNFWVWGDGR